MKKIIIALICLVLLSGCTRTLDDGLIIQKRHIPETSSTFESWYLEIKDDEQYDHDLTTKRQTIQLYSKGEYDSYKIGDYWVRPKASQ